MHDPIISKPLFKKAQALNLIRQQHFWNGKPPAEYPLSRQIECGECGHTFKRRICNGKIYWACYNHNLYKENCSIKQIPEQIFYEAFITLYYKLKSNARYILNPILADLQALQTAYAKWNERIGQLNKEIAELTEQNLALNRLRSKGYMDSAIFMSQSNEINAKLQTIRTARRQLLDDDDDITMQKTEELIDILDGSPDAITEFDEDLFESMIEKIIVTAQDTLTFRLINGLELTERI